MRSVYCLGAVRALSELGIASEVDSVHASSAGCVSATILLGQSTADSSTSVGDKIDELIRLLAGKRFINSRRVRKVVDVDYLIRVLRETTELSVESLRRRSVVFEVALTNAQTAAASYLDVSAATSDGELYQALRATMAIPILYRQRVTLNGNEYIDGGIADPLPLMRALKTNPEVAIAISSVARASLGAAKSGNDARVIRWMPGIAPVVRELMLTRNPLAECVESIMELGSFCRVPIVRITPSRPNLLSSRIETDRGRLFALESLGYEDAMEALSAFRTSSEEKMAPPQPGSLCSS